MRLIFACLVLIFAKNSLADNIADLVYHLKASVAKVHVVTKTGGHGVGTGVVVGKDLVATNCHVLANASGANITKFGVAYQPVALKADWAHDICVLRFQYLEMPAVTLGESEPLKYEQSIFSIGFSGGTPRPEVSRGKIKALYALDDANIVRTDASFIMGASGSPVFDLEGKLVAISTFKSPGHGAYYYNIPIKWLKELLAQPESSEVTKMKTDTSPFWDASMENRPFFMQVVLPYQNDKWADLEKIAQLWVSKEPNSTEAYYYLGAAQQKLGQLALAKIAFNKALQLHPQHPAALIALGLMANKEGNTTELDKLKIAMNEAGQDVLAEFNEALNPTPDEPPVAK
jgi:serine protease Do